MDEVLNDLQRRLQWVEDALDRIESPFHREISSHNAERVFLKNMIQKVSQLV